MFPLPELGGSSTPINLVVSASTADYNAFTAAGSPAFQVDLKITVNSGVVVSSASAGVASLLISGFIAGSTYTLINHGTIQGAGGGGGAGAGAHNPVGHDGFAGGDAVLSDQSISVNNTGAIQGGGGGASGFGSSGVRGANGGGGGQGNVGGIGGAGGPGDTIDGNPGPNGTPSAPGGNAGTWGVAGSSNSSGSVGGAGGYAIRCTSGHVSLSGAGTINGAVS